MSAQAEAPGPGESEDSLTVFDGSSPEDASHARQLWSSLSLLPPLESRLVSADIHQRLPVYRPQRGGTAAASPAPKDLTPEPPNVPALRQRQEERQWYAAMADQRREILATLRRQRKKRIQKELVSVAFQPKVKLGKEMPKPRRTSDCDADEELVKQLQ